MNGRNSKKDLSGKISGVKSWTWEKQKYTKTYSETYFGTNTMKPFDLIFNILASVSVGLHKSGHKPYE